jgi:hypothetical protein
MSRSDYVNRLCSKDLFGLWRETGRPSGFRHLCHYKTLRNSPAQKRDKADRHRNSGFSEGGDHYVLKPGEVVLPRHLAV